MKRNLCLQALLCLHFAACGAQRPPHDGAAMPVPPGAPPPVSAPVTIYGQLMSKEKADSVTLTLWEDFLYEEARYPAPYRATAASYFGNLFEGALGGQIFRFVTPAIQGPAYISLAQGKGHILRKYLVAPGDSVQLLIDPHNHRIVFAGPAADRFRCQQELHTERATRLFAQRPGMGVADREGFLGQNNYREALAKSREHYGRGLEIYEKGKGTLARLRGEIENTGGNQVALEILDRYRGKVEDGYLSLLKADHLGETLRARDLKFQYAYNTAKAKNGAAPVQGLEALYHQYLSPPPALGVPDSLLALSANWPAYLLVRAYNERAVKGTPVYHTLKSGHTGALRDKLLAHYLVRDYKSIANGPELLDGALSLVEAPWAKDVLEGLRQRQGTKARLADIALEDVHGNNVKLSEMGNKVLFIDFWFTGCMAYVFYYRHTIKAVERHFKDDEGFAIVSISADKDRDKWLQSTESGKYTSEGAINLHAQGPRHPFLQYYNIHSFPHQMLVKDGTVYRSGGFTDDVGELISLIETVKKTAH